MIFFIKSFYNIYISIFINYISGYKLIYMLQVSDNQKIKLLKENTNLIKNLIF